MMIMATIMVVMIIFMLVDGNEGSLQAEAKLSITIIEG